MPPLGKARIWILLIGAGMLALYLWKSNPLSSRENPDPAVRGANSSGSASIPGNPIASAFGQLQETSDRSDVIRTLKELQARLAAMPRDQAVSWISGFLDQHTDNSTGLSFVIGNDHSMVEWPSFRTFLIDALLAIDPSAAAKVSREILNSSTSADEWALALRNVGKVESSAESNAYLRAKTEELISNTVWQSDPSIGYLNSFDVLVHTNASASTPLLSGLIQQKNRKDLAHAAFLTLDRLVQRNPADVLTRLATDTALTQSRPEMVAQQFARADLRDEAQREIVKHWLLDPTRTATELHSFVGTYPNHNRFVSNNLLTRETPQSGTDLAMHDREALEIIGVWEEEPSCAPVKRCIAAMRQRLAKFVGEGQAVDK